MQIWAFLNTRFIAALWLASLFLCVGWLLFRPFWNWPNTNAKEKREAVDTLAHLQQMSFKEVPTSESQSQKFVGVLRNNSSYLVTRIEGSVSFYDESDVLVDLFIEPLQGIALLKPGEEAAFAITRTNERASNGASIKIKATRSEFRLVDVEIVDEKR